MSESDEAWFLAAAAADEDAPDFSWWVVQACRAAAKAAGVEKPAVHSSPPAAEAAPVKPRKPAKKTRG